MRRLQILVSERAYETMRSFAPEFGSGAIVERMIEREESRRDRAAEKRAANSAHQAKVVAYPKSA